MGSSRPISDTWLLAPCKHKYYGGYPAGFLERARLVLVGGNPDAIIWHVCGGEAKKYNGIKGGVHLTGFGKYDLTKLQTGFPPFNSLTGGFHPYSNKKIHRPIDWVIVGGESGHNARPVHLDWIRNIRDQCVDAKVKFFFKQFGEWVPVLRDLEFRKENRYNKSIHIWDETGIESYVSIRIGKKEAGRLLDGREWNEMP